MSIDKLRELNPNITIYTTDDPIFKKYGKVLDYSTDEVVKYVNEKMVIVKENATYQLDYPELHNFNVFNQIKNDVYGQLNIQFGIVSGLNDYLTGIEFHQGSEVNISFTDCLLLLGKTDELVGTTFDAKKAIAVYLEKGQAVEIYGTTLHYTPIQVDAEGFSLGVILLEGTNSDMDYIPGSFLIKKNKWFICHKSQTADVEAGYIPGLLGEMIHINFE